ncbi:amidase [Horticoccus sp. 23ND18S-11]|uniref:amidase n=1 Tax=Horticoccus sp. 23ND18S-11 TaxID=3391832 RepID=UPI0039C940E3
MTFRDWQELTPAAAARELHRRVITLLPPAQQRAAIAELPSESELAVRFAQAPAAVPLARVPCLVKDLFDVGGQPTFAGSTFLPEVRPTRATDGAFVQAVRRAGAVIAGKTHMHEFAYGITGENAHYGNVEHPRFPGRTTGGSSSGSAAVVAAGIVPFALGSDTGGSVRLPAAFCGLYGFRLAPRGPWISDAVPLAPSYDTAGWFTANAADLKASIAALVGLGRSDRAPRGCYLAMPGVDPDLAAACEKQARPFAAPAEPAVRDALLQGFTSAVDTYNTVVAQEAWAYHQPWAERYQSRYSAPVWQRLIRAHTLTPAQIDAAQVNTVAIRALWERFFAAHDFLVLPASPAPALTPSECTLENRLRILTLTAPASIGGLPVLSVPVPLASGLTSGLQIIVNATTSPVVRWVLENVAAKA